MAASLRALGLHAAQLRIVADADAVVADEAAKKYESADLDLCRLVTAWKEQGWSRDFEKSLYGPDGFFRFGIDEAKIHRASSRAANAQAALRQLGLTSTEAATIAASALL
jgi:hypothetical protein